jgi:hypothetical protein
MEGGVLVERFSLEGGWNVSGERWLAYSGGLVVWCFLPFTLFSFPFFSFIFFGVVFVWRSHFLVHM